MTEFRKDLHLCEISQIECESPVCVCHHVFDAALSSHFADP